MIPAIAVFAAVVVLGFIVMTMYNGLVKARLRVREAYSGIDVQLKRRLSLIPNLVETVKGYASHERETLENVTRARAMLQSASAPGRSGAGQQLPDPDPAFAVRGLRGLPGPQGQHELPRAAE